MAYKYITPKSVDYIKEIQESEGRKQSEIIEMALKEWVNTLRLKRNLQKD